jgi:adenine-specific DNA-methyltransferase
MLNKEHNNYSQIAKELGVSRNNHLINQISPDVIYLDPPYNSRQYSTNYHVLETIAKYDNPTLHGKTGLRDYSDQKSAYCSRPKIKQAFSELIKNAKAKYIFLSYNNEGLMTFDDIKEIMSKKGEYGVFMKEYNRFKADSNRDYSAKKTIEYLHYVVC